MAATVADILTFGENKSRGPLYNRSVAALGTGSYVEVLPANPSRKFLIIKPLSNHIHIHFLTPGGNTAGIQDLNSITLAGGTNDQPLKFDTFVPTNAVYMKANTASVNVAIFES